MRKKSLRRTTNKYRRFHPSESIFYAWLNDNMGRLNHRPVKSGDKFIFDGIIRNISLHVNFSLPESMISYDDLAEKINYDHHVIEYIGWEKHDPEKGYYDADRTDQVYDYFPTRQELYINNVFEPIIEYCNTMFVPENSLYLLDLNGMTVGFIAATDEENNEQLIRHIGSNRIDPGNRYSKVLKYNIFEVMDRS